MSNKFQDNLQHYVGDIKRYKDWCNILKEEPKRGKAKTLQLKQWQQYIDIEPTDKKLALISIYDDNDLQLIENRGKFTTYIENFLMSYLKNCSGQYVVLSNRDILEGAYMVNNNYFKGKWNRYDYINSLSIPIKQDDIPAPNYINQKLMNESGIFFSVSYRLLKRIIYDSLISIEKKSLIQKNKTFRLYKNYTNEYGKEIHSAHNCNDSEIDRILTVQHDSIKEFNDHAPKYSNGNYVYYLHDIRSVHILHKEQKNEFYDILDKNLRKEFQAEGYNAYSTAWKINFANSECFDYELRKFNYNNLNKNVQNKLFTAKDLSIIESTLRKQLIDRFIKL